MDVDLVLVRDLATQATKPHEITAAGADEKVLFHPQHGGLIRLPVPRAPRQYRVATVGDFVTLVQSMHRRATARPLRTPGGEPGGQVCKVLVGAGGVVACLDDEGDNVERVTLPLERTVAWCTLNKLADEGEGCEHEQLIDRLRLELSGCVSPADVSRLRAIRFKDASDGASHVQPGMSSVRSDVMRSALLDSGDNVPETVTVTTAVFEPWADVAEWKYTVDCLFDVLLRSRKFRLAPPPERLAAVQRMTLERIRDALREALPADAGYTVAACP